MASEITFTTNESDIPKLEGLYVVERDPAGFIEGANLSAVGFAGKCVRGPLTVQKISNAARFVEVYGGRDYIKGSTLVGEVWKALLNKKFSGFYVRRVAAAAAAAGTKTLANATPTTIATVSASSVGAWSTATNQGPTVEVKDATDADANHWNLVVSYKGKDTVYENINTYTSVDDNLAAVIGDDIGNLISVVKNASGRPANQGPSALTGGSDGSLAASDYLSGIDDLAATKGCTFPLVPELAVTQATLNTELLVLGAASSDQMFLTWSGSAGNSVSTETGLVASYRSDRIVWCYNAPKTIDPVTGVKIDTAPHVWMACILSNTDVDIHPGEEDTKKYLAGIAALNNETLDRSDLIDLKAAGISSLEKLSEGFAFRSGVTTSLTSGKKEITRRRMTDFLQVSAAASLVRSVKKKNTQTRRNIIRALLQDFSAGLKESERIIETFEINQVSVNTPNKRGQGQERVLWRVRLLGHILELVLETEIGTLTVIETAAA